MIDAFPVPQPIPFLDARPMAELKHPRTSDVVMGRFHLAQHFLKIRPGDVVVLFEEERQSLRGKVSEGTAVDVLRTGLVLGQNPLTTFWEEQDHRTDQNGERVKGRT